MPARWTLLVEVSRRGVIRAYARVAVAIDAPRA
jgi:hypothetical protein